MGYAETIALGLMLFAVLAQYFEYRRATRERRREDERREDERLVHQAIYDHVRREIPYRQDPILENPAQPVRLDVEAKCPFCHALLLDGTALVFCPKCALAHHEDCASTSSPHTCGAFACGGNLKRQIPVPVDHRGRGNVAR